MHAHTAIAVLLVSCASGAIASPVSHSHPEPGRPEPRPAYPRHQNNTYDYVIVGGGTAGNTLAARLAQNPKISVAVIEAGGYYTQDVPELEIPAQCSLYSGTDPSDTNPKVDWGFVTVPQAVSYPSFATGLERERKRTKEQ